MDETKKKPWIDQRTALLAMLAGAFGAVSGYLVGRRGRLVIRETQRIVELPSLDEMRTDQALHDALIARVRETRADSWEP